MQYKILNQLMLFFKTFFGLITIGIGLAAQNNNCRYPIEVAALNVNLLEMKVWDFSHQWLTADDSRTNICIYGDSLISESIDGHRSWYEIKNDSLFFQGEEDRLMSVHCDSATFLCSLPYQSGYHSRSYFSTKGKGAGRKFNFIESGYIEFQSSSHRGRIILSQGDTIANVTLTRERHNITASFPEDTIARNIYMTIETYRWFDKSGVANHLPLALQQSVYYHDVPNFTITKDSKTVVNKKNTKKLLKYGHQLRILN